MIYYIQVGGKMTKEQIILKEIEDKLTYQYAKANTKSKKKKILYDLFNFSNICYNHFGIDKTFPWENDNEMIKLIEDDTMPFVENTLSMKETFADITKSIINTFIEVDYQFYQDYNKLLNGLTPLEIQNITFDFLNSYDQNLFRKYKEKLEKGDMFDVSIYSKTGYSGLTYPLEALKKNLIFCDTDSPGSVFVAAILMHEYGHSFEFDTMYECGVTNYGTSIEKLPYSEVASRFFEYAFLCYLKENKIYEKDASICLMKYYKMMLAYIYKMDIIYKMNFININKYGFAEIKEQEVIDYANKLKEKLNYYSLPSELGQGVNYKESFLYGIGGIFGIYLYENYKQDPNNFKKEFRNALINYKYNDIDAFEKVGITEEKLIKGDILKRILTTSR